VIATNNGSFPWRGTALGEALERALAAPLGAASEEARGLRDRLARQAIDEQVRAGCDLVTDGLVRREDPVGPIIGGLSGISPGEPRSGFPAGGGPYRIPVVRGEVGWKAPILAEDYLFASAGTQVPVKAVLTGPYTLAAIAEDHAYGEPRALAMALAAALNQELRALQAAGARFVQIDEPSILKCPEDFPIFTRVWEVLGRGVQITLVLHLEGGAIGDLYPGLTHLKRLGCLSLDCVTHPGNLEVAGRVQLPDGVLLGLGLVSGERPEVESAEDLAAIVRGATGLPPYARLLLGTGTDLGRLPSGTAAAKLASLAAARQILQSA
jgi:5-methyltetrahydropteroyltriglutamate--homocysteine methyltransferase